MSGIIQILVVEDHPVFREGLHLIVATEPDMKIIACAATSNEAITQFRLRRPDITLMDRKLPGLKAWRNDSEKTN